jgi:hypothetical protein
MTVGVRRLDIDLRQFGLSIRRLGGESELA